MTLLPDLVNIGLSEANLLFMVGFAVEVFGGILLAKGIWQSPAQILRLSWPVWGPHPATIAGYIESKIDGTAGIVGLLLGFVCQTLSFIFGALKNPNILTKPRDLLLATLVAALVVGIMYCVWRFFKGPIAKKMAVTTVLLYTNKEPHNRPNLLASIGHNLGYPYILPKDADGPESATFRDVYIRNTFGITVEELNNTPIAEDA